MSDDKLPPLPGADLRVLVGDKRYAAFFESTLLAYGDACAAAVRTQEYEKVNAWKKAVGLGGSASSALATAQQAEPGAEEQEVSVPISGWTTIPVGTLIFHDHNVYRWPQCNNEEPADPETLFEVSVRGDTVKLNADGFGGNPYRNGSILVKMSHWKQAWATLTSTKKDKP